jgi:hypothetical protein
VPLDASGHETVLYDFTGGADGGNPYGGLIRDSAGNLAVYPRRKSGARMPPNRQDLQFQRNILGS